MGRSWASPLCKSLESRRKSLGPAKGIPCRLPRRLPVVGWAFAGSKPCLGCMSIAVPW